MTRAVTFDVRDRLVHDPADNLMGGAARACR